MKPETLEKALDIKRDIMSLGYFKKRLSAIFTNNGFSAKVTLETTVINQGGKQSSETEQLVLCTDGGVPEELQQIILGDIDGYNKKLEKQLEDLQDEL